MGNIKCLALGGTKLITDRSGRNINPSHLPSITKSFAQTGELASLSQTKARRENDMKKIQSADLKTNIVWLTFHTVSFLLPPSPLAFPCHNFLSLCLNWTMYYNGCGFCWNDLNGPYNAVWMMGAGVCPLHVCMCMCLCTSVCRLQTPFPSAMPNFFHPPSPPSPPPLLDVHHISHSGHTHFCLCVFFPHVPPLFLYPHHGGKKKKRNCPLTLIR